MKDFFSGRKALIPDYEIVKKGIDELLLMDKWDDYKIKRSPERFAKRLDELFISKLGIILQLIYLGDDKSIPKTFYRVRKQTPTFNERLISEYLYPPNHFVKNVQRANISYHPVFYCSDNPATSISETYKNEEKANDKTVYYMSEWVTKDNQEIRICPFIFDNVADTNPYKKLSEITKSKLFDQMKAYTEEEKNSVFEVLKLLSHLFTYENTYVVSSYIAHTHLYALHNLRPDVFIYPSIQTRKTTVNFAFHPNAVFEKLKLKRIFKMGLSDFDKETGTFTMHVTWIGHNNQGVLQWKMLDDKTPEGRGAINEFKQCFHKN